MLELQLFGANDRAPAAPEALVVNNLSDGDIAISQIASIRQGTNFASLNVILGSGESSLPE